jgi:thioredoxin reductase (NADPH)
MVRSIFLRGFDQQMAGKIAEHMGSHHTKFIRNATPSKLEKLDSGRIQVTFNQEGKEQADEYDTVLFAIGRYALTAGLNLDAAGLKVEKNGKFIVNEHEQTSVPHIYAIGDIQHGKLELTPTAIQAGMLLSDRLYGNKTKLMDYTNVATTVFTPLEYGCVGLSEEEATEKFGDDLDVYHTSFKPLEWAFDKLQERSGYTKVLVQISTDKVVGFHIVCPNAGEVTQGMGVAFKCGLTKAQLDDTVGIHPTVAEEFTLLTKTKKMDPNADKTGC